MKRLFLHIVTLAAICSLASELRAQTFPSAQQEIRLFNTASSQFIGLTPPSNLAASYTLVLPGSQGAAGSILTNNGSGTLSWTTLLPVANGGTGASTLTGIVIGNGTSALTATSLSSGISGVLSDETGSGALVFATAPTLTTLTISSGGAAITGATTINTSGTALTTIGNTGAGVTIGRLATTLNTSVPSGADRIVLASSTGALDQASIASVVAAGLTNQAVTSFSASGTGLTPNTATTGAVTLAGTLDVDNGGTGATTASGARTNLGASTVGANMFTLTNPSAVTFPRFNADNTVSALNAADFRTAIGAGNGTVTSVGLSMPSIFTVTNSPVTTSGTLTATLANQNANLVFAGPTTGAAAAPTFRALVAADIPYGNTTVGSGLGAQGNFGQFQNYSTYTDANANPAYWGWNYVRGNTNAPNTNSTEWYREVVSLGADYPARGAGGYSLELAFPRYNPATAGVWMRTIENGAFGSWTRIDAGAGVTSFSAGTTGLTPNTATTGAITLAGTLNVANGGTGRTSATAYMPIVGGTTTTGAQQSVVAGTTNGQALLFQGASAVPTFGAINLAGGTNIVTGALPVSNGGTGATTLTGMIKGNGTSAMTAVTGIAGGVTYWSDANTIAASAAGTAGQALVSGGTGAPTWFAPTQGSVIFAGASGALAQSNANFFWDNTNARLGIGDATPSAALTVGSGDLFRVNSSGAIEAATGITAAGTISLNTTGSASTTIGNATTSGTTTIATNGATGRLVISGLPTGTTDDVLLINASNQVSRVTQSTLFAGQGWSLLGNASTNPSTNYIGTSDNVDLVIRTFGAERIRVLAGGNVRIGGSIGSPTPSATPVNISLGHTLGTSPVAAQMKLRLYEEVGGGAAGFGFTNNVMGSFAPNGYTHNWYVNDVLAMSVNAAGFITATGLGTTGATDVTFNTSNVERMRILSDGNIRIGGTIGSFASSATPLNLTLGSSLALANTAVQAKLRIAQDFSGSVFGLGATSNQLNYFAPSSTTHNWYINDVLVMNLNAAGFITATGLGTTGGTDVTFNTNNIERIRIQSDGHIRIGPAPGSFSASTTPVSIGMGSAVASSNLASQAKLRIAQDFSGSIFGLGATATQMNYFAPLNATHRWYINDVEVMNLSGTGQTVAGTSTINGLLSANAGVTVLGATNVNTSGAAVTNINTGTSTGAVTIGNASNTGGVTIATQGTTGRLTLTGIPAGTTDEVLLINGTSGVVSRVTQANLLAGAGWALTGNSPSTSGGALGAAATGSWLGTNNGIDLRIVAGNAVRMIVASGGAISMGSTLDVTGRITGTGGATISGAATSINASSNFNTDINTGTSSGIVAIGNAASTTNILGVTNINTSAAAATNIGTGGNTGTVTIGGSGAQTIDIGTGAAVKTVSIGSTNTTSATTINGGNTGSLNLNTSGSGPTNIGTGASSGTVAIGRTSGTITTMGAIGHTGTITSSGLITGNGGATISGTTGITGATSINTTGAAGTSIGNASSTTTILGPTNINTTGSTSTTIGNATTSGTTTIATNGATGRLVITGLPTGTTDDVLLVNSTNGQVSRVTQANLLASAGWALTGNAGTIASNYLGTSDGKPLSIRTNAIERIGLASDGAMTFTAGSVTANGVTAPGITLTGGEQLFGVNPSANANGGNVVISGGATRAQTGSSKGGDVRIYGGNGQFDISTPSAGGDVLVFSGYSNNANLQGSIRLGVGGVGGTERMRITPAGLVLIGSITGTRQLDVTGTFGATGAATLGSSLDVAGLATLASGVTVTGTANVNTSGANSTNIGNASSTTTILGTTNINTSGTTATNINTGTSTGAVTIGNASNTSAVTIATNSTGRLVLTGLPTGTTDDVLLINGSNQVSRVTQSALFAGQGWALTGNSPSTSGGALGAGATGSWLGTNNGIDLRIVAGNAVRMIVASGGAISMGSTLDVTGRITGTGGATISGAATSINASSNFNTDINTGSSSGIVSIGNAASTTNILGATNINTSGATATNIGTGSSTGAVTIGNASNTGGVTIATQGTTGRLALTGIPTGTTDDVLLVT